MKISKRKGAVLIIVAIYYFYLYLKSNNSAVESSSQRKSKNNYNSLSLLFPLQLNESATISIGIISDADDSSIRFVIKQLVNLVTQMNEDQLISSYVIHIAILTYQEKDLKKVRDFFEQENKLKAVPINLITVSEDLVQNHVMLQTVNSGFRLHHKSFVEKRTHFNILVSLLFWHCSQQSEYMIFTDETVFPISYAMKKIKKLFRVFSENPTLIEIGLAKDPVYGRLYNCKYLEKYANFIYWTSVYTSIKEIMNKFKYISLSLQKMSFPDVLFFQSVHHRMSYHQNPEAILTTNMNAYGNHSFSNLYYNGDVFWTYSNLKDSYLTIKFSYITVVRRIKIKTCLTKMMNDCLTNAVLERSHNNECNFFEFVSDFRNSEVDTNIFSDQTTACLRVRTYSSNSEWIAIRELKIYTDEQMV
ncbi:alpha-1,6-mannosyl-glycoprotein 4-beta-N-acetylglucosaminyltransferase isoform X2 [Hydra vulgaris]|uniref:Alpha-1,6-mannosyl-glycoprotein 4-beta-N-acetylglucosaminyltransferase isoform X2 n=1 Tax=Hydra vulgaris TaxID=6087 RepID=A0ABM4B7H6_HYDVU